MLTLCFLFLSVECLLCLDASVGNKNKDSCVGYNMPKINHLFTDLTHLKERNVEDLSGGELQRFACAVVCIQKADMYV